jgi:hypothetical protein
MMNIKTHNKHFLQAKKIGANSKLILKLGSKEFPFVSCVFFYNVSVTKMNVFYEQGSKPN